jgi:hypothetical protein
LSIFHVILNDVIMCKGFIRCEWNSWRELLWELCIFHVILNDVIMCKGFIRCEWNSWIELSWGSFMFHVTVSDVMICKAFADSRKYRTVRFVNRVVYYAAVVFFWVLNKFVLRQWFVVGYILIVFRRWCGDFECKFVKHLVEYHYSSWLRYWSDFSFFAEYFLVRFSSRDQLSAVNIWIESLCAVCIWHMFCLQWSCVISRMVISNCRSSVDNDWK